MKKSYIGYAPKQSNVVKLTNYIQSNTPTKLAIEVKPAKKGNKKRF